VKDGINDHVVHGAAGRVNPARVGTKAAAHYRVDIDPGQSRTIKLRLSNSPPVGDPLGVAFDALFSQRVREADQFYAAVIPGALPEDARAVMRQALGGLLWSKQFYHYDVKRWLEGDPAGPPPPAARRHGRNHTWTHLSFYECFHGDTGAGIGASHQTGWTALVAKLLEQAGRTV
jgi:hypothetical protein